MTNLNKIQFATIGIIIFLFNSAYAFSGPCVGVSDGDTITILQGTKQVKVRLYGIDCPEKNQPYGKSAKIFTSSLVYGKYVSLDIKDTDRYGRTVAIVYQDKTCINEELLKNGFAWVYTQYYKGETWQKLEAEAREAQIGLWRDDSPTPPWEWRRSGKTKYSR